MAPENAMKAIVYHEYGSPDVLEFQDVDKPVVRNDEVLVRVHAASVNSWDWDLLTGRVFRAVGRHGLGNSRAG